MSHKIEVGSGFLSSGTGEVMVRIFPGTDVHVEVRKVAATHLLRLLERYNWTLSDRDKSSNRWRKFWPVVSQIERTMVVMFVRSANGGTFGGQVCLQPLPHEMVELVGCRKLVKIDAEVAHEFAALRQTFVQILASADDFKFNWHETHRTVMRMYGDALEVALHSWWRCDGSLDLCDLLEDVLCNAGMSTDDAQQTAISMGLEAEYLIQDREDALCAGNWPVDVKGAVKH